MGFQSMIDKKPSVAPSSSLPNGEDIKDQQPNTEQIRPYIKQYHDGRLNRNELYRQIKALFGMDVFEGTRHCFENMKQRTKKNYAALDPQFEDLPDFLYFMGCRPYKDASIHRKNNDDGYSPENCVWASKATQSRERANTVRLTCDGETLPLTEWADRLEVSPQTLRKRIKDGWSECEVIHGKKGDNASCSPGSHWPGNHEYYERRFREARGKTQDERLALIFRIASDKIQNLSFHWSNYIVPILSDGMTEEETAKANRIDDQLKIALKLKADSENELMRRRQFELLAKVKTGSIVDMFRRKRGGRYNTDDYY